MKTAEKQVRKLDFLHLHVVTIVNRSADYFTGCCDNITHLLKTTGRNFYENVCSDIIPTFISCKAKEYKY
jgi:hypothetical protein